MTLEDLHASLPPELRVTLTELPDELRVTELPESIQETLAYLAFRDGLWDQGVPGDEIQAFEEWKAARHG